MRKGHHSFFFAPSLFTTLRPAATPLKTPFKTFFKEMNGILKEKSQKDNIQNNSLSKILPSVFINIYLLCSLLPHVRAILQTLDNKANQRICDV